MFEAGLHCPRMDTYGRLGSISALTIEPKKRQNSDESCLTQNIFRSSERTQEREQVRGIRLIQRFIVRNDGCGFSAMTADRLIDCG